MKLKNLYQKVSFLIFVLACSSTNNGSVSFLSKAELYLKDMAVFQEFKVTNANFKLNGISTVNETYYDSNSASIVFGNRFKLIVTRIDGDVKNAMTRLENLGYKFNTFEEAFSFLLFTSKTTITNVNDRKKLSFERELFYNGECKFQALKNSQGRKIFVSTQVGNSWLASTSIFFDDTKKEYYRCMIIYDKSPKNLTSLNLEKTPMEELNLEREKILLNIHADF